MSILVESKHASGMLSLPSSLGPGAWRTLQTLCGYN